MLILKSKAVWINARDAKKEMEAGTPFVPSQPECM
jgi:hypothetical protein